MRALHLIASLSLCLAFTACSCEGDPSGSDAGLGGGTGGHTDGGDEQCAGGTLCGDPAVCCPAGNECISGACMPSCDSEVRCGASLELCCPSGDLCVANACATPGASCGDSYDCEPGQFCEPTLGQCLTQPPGGPACVVVPDFAELQVTEELSFDADIISIPVVADLDGDGAPEIVVNAMDAEFTKGNIVILNGPDFAVKHPGIEHDPGNDSYGSHGRTGIALGDVSGDGLPDIVYISRPVAGVSRVVAVDGSGAFLFASYSGTPTTPFTLPASAIDNAVVTLANFDDDPMAEIVVGGVILDHDGRLIWEAGSNGDGAALGSNGGYKGGVAAVADLDGDGSPELITGADAFRVTWSTGAVASASVSPYWVKDAGIKDGYPAVADLDGDGKPEVVLVSEGHVTVRNGQTGALFCAVDPTDAACQANANLRVQPFALPGGTTNNRGGPPTIADFDGNGKPDIGVAGGHAYGVFILKATGQLGTLWSKPTQDLSSNASGASVFDFEGDGAAEVVYNDECYMRVYSGVDGRKLLEIANTTATIHEYPLVVDADGDGNSEILLVANTPNSEGNCAGVTPRRGLYMYGDPNDKWVPTRRVWTQHSYHVTNATSSGNVPLREENNWTSPGLNNYRQNAQGEGVFNAPDLAIDLSVSLDGCPRGKHLLRARVSNVGALGAPAGVSILVERTTGGAAVELGTLSTTKPLLPGQSETLQLEVDSLEGSQDYRATADSASNTSGGNIDECNEDNNSGVATEAHCVVIGGS